MSSTRNRTSGLAYAMSGIALVCIWVSVVLASIFSPAMVTGTQHDHLAVAWGDWVWGMVATGVVVAAVINGIRAGAIARASWVILGVTVSVAWLWALFSSIFTPSLVTGTDPTVLPLAAMGTPIIAMVFTIVMCNIVRSTLASGAAVGSTTWFPKNAYTAWPAAAGPTPQDATAGQLRQLADLHGAGIVTDQEFETKKAQLLSRM